MGKKRVEISVIRAIAVILLLGALLLTVSPSQADPASGDRFSFHGDFRLRLESDRDSQTADGTLRDDRTRVRVRVRAGLSYRAGDRVDFGLRLRSGSDDSHQSPHITIIDFDDNDTGDADFNLDKWFVKARQGRFWGWAGRNAFPFWKQNELFWDDDATLAGLAGGYSRAAGEGSLTLTAGYFSLPAGIQEFSGNLGAAQLVYATEAGPLALTVAGGWYGLDAEPDDPDSSMLLRGNGMRDYSIWVGSAQAKLAVEVFGEDQPLSFGFDLMHNEEDYPSSDPDPFTAANRGQTDGYVLSVRLGGLNERGQWLAAYHYAHLEPFAVNASYAQDDWVRWGTAVESRGSDMKGHELRFAYAATAKMNIVARLYLVESITTREDGNRFRVDFNRRF